MYNVHHIDTYSKILYLHIYSLQIQKQTVLVTCYIQIKDSQKGT